MYSGDLNTIDFQCPFITQYMSNVLFKSEIFKSKIYPCNCYFLSFFDYGTRTQDLPQGDVGVGCTSQLHYQSWNFCFHFGPQLIN